MSAKATLLFFYSSLFPIRSRMKLEASNAVKYHNQRAHPSKFPSISTLTSVELLLFHSIASRATRQKTGVEIKCKKYDWCEDQCTT